MMSKAQELTAETGNQTPETQISKTRLSTRQSLSKVLNVPCLYRHINGTYYAIKKHKGEQKTISLDTKDRKIAERKLRVWISNLDKIDTQASKTTLEQLIEKFVAGRKGMASKTQQTEASIIKGFKTNWNFGLEIRIEDIRPTMLNEWLAEQESKVVNSSYNRLTQFLHQIFQLALDDKMIFESPYDKITKPWKDPKKTARKRIIPTDEQFRAVVENIRQEKQNFHAEQSANFIELMGQAGLGQAEVSRLTWGDINWSKPPMGEMTVRRQKTGKPFEVPIYPELKPLLEKLYATAHTDGNPPSPETYLFEIKDARKSLTNACKRLGFPKFIQRSLRAFLISKLHRKKVNHKKIAKWQGHSDGGKLILNTYTEVFSDDDEEYNASELSKLL